jgi:AbrB family looped-hinge helix DNA binding protein
MIHTMKTAMDSAGRLVIPKEIRRKANITPETVLDVRWKDGLIEIEPEALPVRLERKGRLLVAHPQRRVPALRHETVEETRKNIRHRA